MANYTLKHIGVVTGAVAGVIMLGAFAIPFMASDAPPWASRARVIEDHEALKRFITNAKNELKSDAYFNRAQTFQRERCRALKEGNSSLAASLSDQLSDAQRIYMQLSGDLIPLPSCSEL